MTLATILKNQSLLVHQFSRFVGIGFLNTAVDFSIINILIAASGITQGGGLAALKVCSFSIAVVHSYVWNKAWAFNTSQEKLVRFLAHVTSAALVGLAIVGLSVFGANKSYGLVYFIVLGIVLICAELALWRLLQLNLGSSQVRSETRQFWTFIVVSLIGALIAAATVWIFTRFIDPQFGFNDAAWANIANILATAVGLVWNFIGYKLFVFRS